jgi:two-component system sensor histidine kinase YesM
MSGDPQPKRRIAMKNRRFRDLSISTKFLITLTLFLILPMMLLFAFFNTNISAELRRRTCSTVFETLKQAETPIDSMVSDTDYVSKEILSSSAVQDYLRRCNTEPPEKLYEYRYPVDLLLGRLFDSRAYLLHAALFSKNGTLLTQNGAYMVGDALPENVASLHLEVRPLCWLPAKDNQAYVSIHERGVEVTALRTINDLHQYADVLGSEKLTISEDYLCGLYGGQKDKSTKNIWLMDADGNVISSLDKSLLGKNLSGEQNFAQVTRQQEGYFLKDGELVTFCFLKKPGWYLVRTDDYAGLSGGRMYNLIFLLCLGLIFVFGAAFYLVQRKTIIRPITELSGEVQRFHDGSYTFTERRNANDEIGLLNRSCVEMGRYIEDLIEKVYKSQLTEKEAQLRYLQSQINPHFLNNTLESIRWMALRNKQPDIAAQAAALARLFKHALNGGREMTTVREEIANLQDYALIQQNRFGSRLEILIDADQGLLDCTVLNLILQPLVENAIVHGLEGKLGHGVVEVKIRESGGNLVYTVEDNGLGTDPAPVRQALREPDGTDNAFALTNLQKRLQYKYGKEYGITFDSTPGAGTTVTVVLPKQEGTDNEAADR